MHAVPKVRREVVLAPDAVERPVAARGVRCRVAAAEHSIHSVSRPVPTRVMRLQRPKQHASAVVRSVPGNLEVYDALRIRVHRRETQQQPGAGQDLLDPPPCAALPEGYVARALASLVELHDGGRAHARRRRGARGAQQQEEAQPPETARKHFHDFLRICVAILVVSVPRLVTLCSLNGKIVLSVQKFTHFVSGVSVACVRQSRVYEFAV